jgi:hypothetical protein
MNYRLVMDVSLAQYHKGCPNIEVEFEAPDGKKVIAEIVKQIIEDVYYSEREDGPDYKLTATVFKVNHFSGPGEIPRYKERESDSGYKRIVAIFSTVNHFIEYTFIVPDGLKEVIK